jgi:Redoxin
MFLKPLFLAAAAAFFLPAHDPLPELPIGTALPAPNVKMRDVVGGETELKRLAGANGLLVIFSCNTCPFVVGSDGSAGWEGRYPELGELCRANGIGFALVNSNAAKRDAGDSYTDMQKHYKDQHYNGHYLLDENSAVADAFGARTTPHVYLFGKDLKLVYKGAIDDNVDDAKAVTKHYLKDAISSMMAAKSIDPATTKNLGCSIKRVPHKD